MARVINRQSGKFAKGRKFTSDFFGVATTRQLTRVIASVWDEPKTKTAIGKETGISGRKIDDAINWLSNHDILEKYHSNGATKLWKLNENHKPKLTNHIYKSPKTAYY